METIFTPWRHRYLAEPGQQSSVCFFCAAATAPPNSDTLVVDTSEHHIVMLNLHPYSNGHLMVAPRAHVASPELAAPSARAEFWDVVLRARGVLERAYHPQGFNFGMNLGRSAGAGVPDHYHLHVVPRWDGDTNFMTVVSGTRLVPEDLATTRDRLRDLFREISS